MLPQLRVAQYNVLSQACATRDERGFPHVDPQHLQEGPRAARVAAEILRADADVVCMQEFDHTVGGAESQLKRALGGHYDLHGTPQVRHTLCVGVKKGSPWRGTTVAQSSLWDTDVSLPPHLRSTPPSATQQWLAVVLRHAETGHAVAVVTTHLKSGAEHAATREAQAYCLVKHIHSTTEVMGKPIILCGDLNGPPTEAAYRLLVDKDCFPVPLQSVYAEEEDTPGHFTTRKVRAAEKCVCEDYILYPPAALEAVAKRRLPTDMPYPYLPNEQHGSDHLLLCATFQLRCTPTG